MDNVLVLAARQGFSSQYDLEIVTLKYSSTGHLLWLRTFDGSTHAIDFPNRLGVDSAGNVYVTGLTYGRISDRDLVVLAYDPSGALLWKRIFDHGLSDGPRDMVVDSAGTVYLTGWSRSHASGMDILTLAYDASGNLLWERHVDGPGGGDDFGMALELDRTGRLVVTGSVGVTGSGSAFATTCYDLAGKVLWSRLYDPSTGDDAPSDLALDGQGNVFVTGSCEEFAGAARFRGVTVAYDASGNQRWVRRHGVSSPVTAGSFIAADASGDLVLAGSGRGLRTLKLDGGGRLLWERVYSEEGWAWALALDASGRAFVVGSGKDNGTPPMIAMSYDTQGNRLWSEVLGGSVQWLSTYGFTLALDSREHLLLAGQVQVAGSYDARGTTLAYRPTCDASIEIYCTAKPSSQGCAPTIALLDAPSATKGVGSTLEARDLIAGQVGLFLHGTSGAASTPFHGGFLCLSGPWTRHLPRSTGGSGTACAGALEEDLNAYIASGVDPRLVAGATVYVQAWSRDPGDPTLDSLSDAVAALICP